MEPASFPDARLRPPRGLRLLYGLTVTLAGLILGVATFVPELRAVMLAWGALISVPLALGVRQLRRHSPAGGGKLEVHRDGVHVEGRLALPRAAIERAVVVRDGRGAAVSILRAGGFTSLVDVTSAEQGEALVRALELSADQAVATFRLDSPVAARLPTWAHYLYLATFSVLVLWPLARHAEWTAAALGAAWFAGVLAALLPCSVTVGTDGVLVRWLWRAELIRFADLRGVERDGERLLLFLADGSRRALSARWEASGYASRHGLEEGFSSRQAYLEAIVARVRESLAARGQAGERARARVARRGRPAAAWITELRGVLVRGVGGFREAELSADELWRTLEDGGADPEARAGAAVALGPTLSLEERVRLRTAARVVAAPRLRIALEAVADGDEARVEEALAEIEAAAGAGGASRSFPQQ